MCRVGSVSMAGIRGWIPAVEKRTRGGGFGLDIYAG